MDGIRGEIAKQIRECRREFRTIAAGNILIVIRFIQTMANARVVEDGLTM